MTCCALSKEDAQTIWPIVEPMFQRVVDRDRGRSSTDTIKNQIYSGDSILWANQGLEIVWITSIEIYATGKKVCLVQACAGSSLSACQEAIKHVEQYAKDVGCEMVEIIGREGWLRTLDGFSKDNIVMSKEL